MKFKFFLNLLGTATALIWLIIVSLPDKNLHLFACDVGQGDAILISLGKFQILTDGGLPDNKVLTCLTSHMPFWDRKIDIIILTHPQLDHYGGLIEIFKRYQVGIFLANSVDGSSHEYELLKNVVGGKGIRVVNPIKGMKVNYRSLYLDILNPDQDLYNEATPKDTTKTLGAYETKRDLNDFSVVDTLHFGNFAANFNGDIGPARLGYILKNNQIDHVDYLKVPHHGSKNGLTEDFLIALIPKIAVISVGAKNRYGHPNKETLNLLAKYNILTKRTDQDHEVEIISDGKSWWVK